MYKIVVLIKQVPDTQNVGPDAMNSDGTVNRQALPAIFNPEDLKALEMALQVKEQNPGTEITVLTMGPDRAAAIIRDALSRGADKGVIISDMRFAGSDTLATSYALACAIKKIGHYDMVFGGRQAIDGDTAQVGPQVAEKLNLPQITYAEKLVSLKGNTITLTRRLDNGNRLPLSARTPSAEICQGRARDMERRRHRPRNGTSGTERLAHQGEKDRQCGACPQGRAAGGTHRSRPQ